MSTAAAAPAPPDSGALTPLEAPCPLSESRLWALQRSFFARQGVDAWRDGTVPHYVTSNAFIARAYARVVLGFLRDLAGADGRAAGQAPETVYVVELGAGSGRFGWHFLRHLGPLLAASGIGAERVVYVMTDFSRSTIDAWADHPSLAPFLADGRLALARFDAAEPGVIVLEPSGAVIPLGGNPLVVIANYVFDSLPQDCFTFRDGIVYEELACLCSPPDVDPSTLDGLEGLGLSWEPRVRESDAAPAADPWVDHLLEGYRQRLGAATVLVPTVPLRCVRHFHDLSDGRLLVLSADKGDAEEADLVRDSPPDVAVHGSVSLTVNYHAIGEFVRLRGGQALHPSHRPAYLLVAAYVFGRQGDPWPETAQAYRDSVAAGGPDDLYALKKAVEASAASLSLEQLLAFLRLTGWDSKAFADLFDALAGHLDTASPTLRQEIRTALARVWETYYPIGEALDVPLLLGAMASAVGAHEDALRYLEHSAGTGPPDSDTRFARAVSHYMLGHRQAALDLLGADEVGGSEIDAAELRRRIVAELATESQT
ncbi:MAG: hypothetical protein QOH36_1251 [Actinomycetota bacterium]|nr:hypothetical protein [Actinomycetota bacterium]